MLYDDSYVHLFESFATYVVPFPKEPTSQAKRSLLRKIPAIGNTKKALRALHISRRIKGEFSESDG
ncbi:MAG: hypothetical protein LKJ27_10160 [Clostridiales bacterium]|jgi:hypothetical protein|nr:hypothetical protein [Clostridiales bacterium]